MRVAFCSSALNDPRAYRFLTDIFWLFVDGRHHWVVDDTRLVVQSTWFKNEGRFNQKQIEEQLKNARPHDGRQRLILVGDEYRLSEKEWLLKAEDARDYLNRPVSIFVENLDSDGTFIRLVMMRLGEKKLSRLLGRDVYDYLKNKWTGPQGVERWFLVEHGAGSTLPMCIRRLIELTGRVPPPIFVLVDSDKKHPDDSIGNTAKITQDTCDKLPTQFPNSGWSPNFRILRKREVENYIPLDAMEAHVGPNKVDSLRACNETQQAYYDFKGGFRADLSSASDGIAPPRDPAQWSWKDTAQKQLYESLKADQFRRLLDGFGNNAWEALKEKNDNHLHAAALRDSAGDQGEELDKLIDAAVELL